jgi:hypothetical protein
MLFTYAAVSIVALFVLDALKNTSSEIVGTLLPLQLLPELQLQQVDVAVQVIFAA